MERLGSALPPPPNMLSLLYEDCDIDLTDFLFEELMAFDPVPSEGAGSAQQARTTQLRKRKASTSTGAINKQSRAKARKNKAEMTVKLPEEVRSTEFAKYMLGEQFKFVPEHEAEPAELRLYSFPRFSRFDALFYIPSTLASFMNSGDCNSISELFSSFWHRDCLVKMGRSTKRDIPVPTYLESLWMFLELHPDNIMCMHSTKDIGNEICADMYFKCTNNKVIHDSVARLTRASHQSSGPAIVVPPRAEFFKQSLSASLKSAEEDRRFKDLMESDTDVELYAHVELRLCFNKHSKKIMHMSVFIDITSCQAAQTSEKEV